MIAWCLYLIVDCELLVPRGSLMLAPGILGRNHQTSPLKCSCTGERWERGSVTFCFIFCHGSTHSLFLFCPSCLWACTYCSVKPQRTRSHEKRIYESIMYMRIECAQEKYTLAHSCMMCAPLQDFYKRMRNHIRTASESIGERFECVFLRDLHEVLQLPWGWWQHVSWKSTNSLWKAGFVPLTSRRSSIRAKQLIRHAHY